MDSPDFKFVDRRRFNEEGDLRESAPAEPAAPVTPPPVVDEKVEVDGAARGPIDFALFIQSLAHQVLMGLGLVPWPDSGVVRKQLEMARETLDLMSMLQEKTKGNLSGEESKMLETLLYELRIAYVQVLQEKPLPPA